MLYIYTTNIYYIYTIYTYTILYYTNTTQLYTIPYYYTIHYIPNIYTTYIHTIQVSDEIMQIKRTIPQYLECALKQAVSIHDLYSVQNTVIYYWNLHVHVFRNNLYELILPEVVSFLTTAITSIDTLLSSSSSSSTTTTATTTVFDQKLRLSLIETLCSYYEYKNMFPEAIDLATKGCSSTGSSNTTTAGANKGNKGTPTSTTTNSSEITEYNRKKICEQYSRLTILQSTNTSTTTTKGNKSTELIKFDNNFLTLFSIIIQAELQDVNKTQENIVGLISKAIEILEKDIQADLSMMDFNLFTQVIMWDLLLL